MMWQVITGSPNSSSVTTHQHFESRRALLWLPEFGHCLSWSQHSAGKSPSHAFTRTYRILSLPYSSVTNSLESPHTIDITQVASFLGSFAYPASTPYSVSVNVIPTSHRQHYPSRCLFSHGFVLLTGNVRSTGSFMSTSEHLVTQFTSKSAINYDA